MFICQSYIFFICICVVRDGPKHIKQQPLYCLSHINSGKARQSRRRNLKEDGHAHGYLWATVHHPEQKWEFQHCSNRTDSSRRKERGHCDHSRAKILQQLKVNSQLKTVPLALNKRWTSCNLCVLHQKGWCNLVRSWERLWLFSP